MITKNWGEITKISEIELELTAKQVEGRAQASVSA
jgi:hypothetical protein